MMIKDYKQIIKSQHIHIEHLQLKYVKVKVLSILRLISKICSKIK